jgi:hypothetical protein
MKDAPPAGVIVDRLAAEYAGALAGVNRAGFA